MEWISSRFLALRWRLLGIWFLDTRMFFRNKFKDKASIYQRFVKSNPFYYPNTDLEDIYALCLRLGLICGVKGGGRFVTRLFLIYPVTRQQYFFPNLMPLREAASTENLAACCIFSGIRLNLKMHPGVC